MFVGEWRRYLPVISISGPTLGNNLLVFARCRRRRAREREGGPHQDLLFSKFERKWVSFTAGGSISGGELLLFQNSCLMGPQRRSVVLENTSWSTVHLPNRAPGGGVLFQRTPFDQLFSCLVGSQRWSVGLENTIWSAVQLSSGVSEVECWFREHQPVCCRCWPLGPRDGLLFERIPTDQLIDQRRKVVYMTPTDQLYSLNEAQEAECCLKEHQLIRCTVALGHSEGGVL
jgi:hypothetical protein